MTDTEPNPPRVAQALLRVLVKPSDAESIPGDLLEEYREVRLPSLGRVGADAWYIKHVLSMLWRITWPYAVAIAALRVLSFPLAGAWNPSLVPAPGVSVLDAAIFLAAGYAGARRTGRIVTGLVTSGITSVIGFKAFFLFAAAGSPGLLLAPFEKPFIFAIVSILLVMALAFGLTLGTIGAAAGRWLSPAAGSARSS